MNWLDVLIIITLVLAAFSGWRTGIVRSAFMLAGIVLGIVLGGQLGGRVGEGLGQLGAPGGSRLLGFAVVFGFCVVASYVSGIFARKILSTLLLGWVDSLGGLVLGLVTSALGWTALIVAAGSTQLPWATDVVQSSGVASALANRGSIVLAMLPGKYRSALAWVGEVKPPTVAVVNATVRQPSPDKVMVEAPLRVTNPNRFGGVIQRVRYEYSWQDGTAWRAIGSGERKNVPLEAQMQHDVPMSLELKRDAGPDAAAFLAAVAQGQPLTGRAQGTVTIAFPSEVVEAPFTKDLSFQKAQ